MRHTPPGGRKLTRRRMRKKREKYAQRMPVWNTLYTWEVNPPGSFWVAQEVVERWLDRISEG